MIATSAGRNYRWIFIKITTSEPGIYGIGSASNHFQPHAVIAAIEKHRAPWLIGKNPEQIEDLWQSGHLRTYWRNGPVNNNVLSGMDMALWDNKSKRAGMDLNESLAAKYPLQPAYMSDHYPLDRTMDGTVVKPWQFPIPNIKLHPLHGNLKTRFLFFSTTNPVNKH